MSAVLLAAGALALLPQTVVRETPRFDRHLRAVRAERTALFAEAWRTASDAARAGAAAQLAALRRAGAPQGSRPAFGALARATAVLTGDAPPAGGGDGQGEAADALRAAAAALDLMVVPGAFDAREEGRGPALRVRAYPLYAAPPPDDVVVSLWWIAPDGERRRARRERVARDAFRRPGFDLFVTAPLSAPGVWTLELQLELEESELAATGVPVAVECVAAAGARADESIRALAGAPEVAVRHELVEIDGLLRRGLRDARGPALAERLVALEMGRVDGPRAQLSPELGEPWGWVREPAGPPRVALVLLTPSQESPLAVFRPGRGWLRLADERDAVVLSAAADLEAGTSPADRVAWVRERFPDVPVVLVARGDTVARLRFSMLAGRTPVLDGLVLCAEPAAAQHGMPFVPTLVVHRAESEVPERAEGSTVTFAAGSASSFLSELGLPEEVAAWLPRVAPADR